MLSIHDLWNLGAAGAGAGGAETYYHDTTAADRESHALPVAPEGTSEGITYAFGEHALADLRDGARLTRDDIRDMLKGDWRGAAVQNAHAEDRFMGWDATFSVPKSLSVAYAVAEPETRRKIEDAVLSAARKVVDVLHPEMYSRIGKGGREHIAVSPVATIYVQRNSRSNDPQIHAHVVIPSFAYGADGRVHTVEFGEVYRSKLAGGASFRVELAHQVEQRTGLHMHRDADGEIRIDGISPALEDYFSKRSEQIEQRLGPDAYHATAAQKAAATVASRPAHDRGYREDWRAQARDTGLDGDWQRAVESIQHALEAQREGAERLSPEERALRLDEAVEAARNTITFGGVSAVTGKPLAGAAVVDARQVLAETAARAVGTAASLDEVQAAIDRAMERGKIVTLAAGETPGSAKVTTPEMITLERRLTADWRALLDRETHGVSAEHVAQATREWEAPNPGEPVEPGKHLSDGQAAAVAAMTAGYGAALVGGLAGSGKTEALAVARRAYELAGYRVVGESYSGAAASEMQKAAGIRSRTTALAEVHGRDLNSRTVVVMDEAARATSPQLAALMDEAKRAGAKVVLVGDPHQLQPIGAGNAFPRLADDVRERAPLASAAIQEIRRQEHAAPEVREVAEQAARGQAAAALKTADEHGMVHVRGTADEARRAAAVEIADKMAEGKRAMGITATREDARAVNEAVRHELQARGALPADERTYTAHAGRKSEKTVAVATGDKVAFTHNSYDLGVRNGWSGTVAGIAPTGTVTVRLDDHVRTDRVGNAMRDAQAVTEGGRTTWRTPQSETERYVQVPAAMTARVVGHDYARTADRSQGITVDHASVVGHADSNRMDRQWGAVAFTRQRETISVHLSAEGMERPETRRATYEPGHWPRDLDGQEPQPNPIRDAREQREQAKAAVQDARETWHEGRDRLAQARQELRDARQSGDGERVAAAKETVAERRADERDAHAEFRQARGDYRAARDHARDTWRAARSATVQHGKDGQERPAPEPRPVSPEARQEAVRAAAKRLQRDRPGASTLDYGHDLDHRQERGHGQDRGRDEHRRDAGRDADEPVQQRHEPRPGPPLEHVHERRMSR